MHLQSTSVFVCKYTDEQSWDVAVSDSPTFLRVYKFSLLPWGHFSVEIPQIIVLGVCNHHHNHHYIHHHHTNPS
jgi:hypothetical protein